MDVVHQEVADARPVVSTPFLNDFSLVVATANGTGSQTANLTLMRSFFQMGLPVNGKNVFPSNIQGLPTWFHIRVSKDGYLGRKESALLVAFNQATVDADLRALPAGGAALVRDDLHPSVSRDDITLYTVPVKAILEVSDAKGKVRDYLGNMSYVGVLAWQLGIPLEVVERALTTQFGGRKKLVDPNMLIVRSAHTWAQANLQKRDGFAVAPMNETAGMIMMTGNEAGALGSVFGGVGVTAWYPITPSTSLVDALREFLPQLRPADANGERNYAVVQAEDELAAIGMVMGAGFAGARAMTATSGPGISLMAEFTGLGYFAEVPGVIWDIQRVGPSTGMPTRTSQGDLAFAYGLGHGDARHPVFLPSSIEECFEFGWRALDLADEAQTPVFVLSDLDLGMNNWIGEPFHYPEGPLRRGKVLSADQVEAQGFARYRDVDGDGIGYRTLPGNTHPRSAYFARGTSHNSNAGYTERSDDWIENMARLKRKFETIRGLLPAPEVDLVPSAEVGVIAFGTTRYALAEARDRMAERGQTMSTLRLKALPPSAQVRDFLAAHRRVVVLEMNHDAQLFGILAAEYPDLAPRLRSIAYLDGVPLTADFIDFRMQPFMHEQEA
jgi:2-oxoglutarate/2-oxoacid ferredoxin oxidoreductase subunit alpha